jgi:hypothetical protein
MAWTGITQTEQGPVVTRPAGVIVEKSLYYEYRPDPIDNDWLQYRKRVRTITEYRGLDLAAAEFTYESQITDFGTLSESIKPIAGGGYTITRVEDFAEDPGEWASLPLGNS